MSVVANVAINVDSRGATQKLREVQSQSQATERAVGSLGSSIGKLAAALGAIEAARFVFVKTAELESQARSLQVLTGSAEKAGRIIKDLQQLGAVTPFTSSELIDSAKRLQAFGVETNKVVDTTRRLADVSGATGAELQGLVTAFGQVQAKGRLQGEELLQFQERGVALQQELRKQYNLSGEEFQDALQKGKISAEAVEFAIQSLTDAGGKYANGAIAQSDTLNGRFSTLQDGIEGLARSIGAALTPAIKAVLNEAIFAVNAINELLNTGARAKAFGLDQRGRQQILKQAQDEAADIVNRRRIADPFERNRQFQQIAAQRERDLIEAFGIRTGQVKPTVTAPQTARTLPPLGAGTTAGGRSGRSEAERAAEKAAREAERLRKELEQSLKVGDQLGTQFTRQILLLDATSEIERKRLQIQFDFENRAKEIAELKNQEQRINLSTLNDEIQRVEILQLQTEEIKKQVEEFNKRAGLDTGELLRGGAGAFDLGLPDLRVSEGETKIAELKQQLQELSNPINVALNGANAIGDAFGTAFTDVINGAKSAQQALSEVFKKIADAFIETATQIIAKQIALITFQSILNALGGGGGFSFSGGGPVSGASVFGSGQAGFNPAAFSGASLFAEGGFVTRPTKAIIGEGGSNEYVIPADKMFGAMQRYNAGARGEAVLKGASTTEQSGGIALMNQPTQINISGGVMQFNDTNYIRQDQVPAIVDQASRAGEARALRKLQQSPSARRKIGM